MKNRPLIDFDKINPGDKIEFVGVTLYWFTDMIENGTKLQIGDIYTLTSKKVFSSHVVITLAETGDREYNLSWFRTL